jgi:hypothetical protein
LRGALGRGVLLGLLTASTLAGSSGPARADHGNDSCTNPPQQGTVAEPNTPAAKFGVDSWIHVIDPIPNPHVGIVKSIYIWENAPNENFVELGYKWITSGALLPNEQYDTLPNVFVVKSVNGSHFLTQKQTAANPQNPGWGYLAEDSDHRFKIVRDTQNEHRFEFYRDNGFVGFYNQPEMKAGFVLAGTEAEKRCDTMVGHFWSLKKCNQSGITPGYCYVWVNWVDAVKLNNSEYPDLSTFFRFNPDGDTAFFWEHCSAPGCADSPT